MMMWGSSPRVWGQAFLSLSRILCPRIIPTRVGTRRSNPKFDSQSEDHPHACGDKKGVLLGYLQVPGSSPRVWGQDTRADYMFTNNGIIPTRVGTRLTNANVDSMRKDHPHACGDKASVSGVKYRLAGSSPRVWGQVWSDVNHSLRFRIIPTRVGTRNHGFSA